MPRSPVLLLAALLLLVAAPEASAQNLLGARREAALAHPQVTSEQALERPLAAVRAPRRPHDRIALLAAAAAPAAATGALWGSADATQNMWRKRHLSDGYESPEAARLNQEWHLLGAGARLMVVVDVGAAIGIGAAARPDIPETLALTGVATVSVLMSHHLAHNVREGQGLFYFGTVAPTDRLARRLGEVPVALVTAAASGAFLYLTYRLLD